ncbi:Signal transduction histidine kinase [Lunatimonas lonarensis]|uniref:histidine kinase n=1 Tax=Lunatimonas lonarensis TaxID=1232681 RepID=R7ZP22_9BACT|nr:ATP-binding protein [Lunatimonas lonarensis]EON75832.1 Signal transduction histidine kinase [Lunatimonas lonarensis]
MKGWKKYYQIVHANFPELAVPSLSIGYWRDYLFFTTIVYVVPFSLMAIIPGVVVSAIAGYYEIIFYDVFLVAILYLIAFNHHFSIQTKKTFFVLIVYVFALILFKNLGSYGPGLVYLLAVSIFAIIIFPDKFSFYTLGYNALFCLIYGLIIHLDIKGLHASDQAQALSWFAVSSNLLFINLLFSILIPRMFIGMEKTLAAQVQLREELDLEQQKLQQSLKDLERKNDELEQFAYVASHDLQEPLRMISGFLSRIDAKYGSLLDDKGKTYIAMAVDGANRMKQIILDLLDYARADARETTEQPIDLNTVLETILQNLQRPIEEKKVSIEIDQLPIVYGSVSQLGQVFQNLIENAIKYCPPDRQPQIRITFEDFTDHYQFSVVDNGIGIEEAHFQRIFAIFQRLHSRDRFEGTGIGLAIVKKIIDSLNGNIWVESEIGKGSTFSFTLKKAKADLHQVPI